MDGPRRGNPFGAPAGWAPPTQPGTSNPYPTTPPLQPAGVGLVGAPQVQQPMMGGPAMGALPGAPAMPIPMGHQPGVAMGIPVSELRPPPQSSQPSSTKQTAKDLVKIIGPGFREAGAAFLKGYGEGLRSKGYPDDRIARKLIDVRVAAQGKLDPAAMPALYGATGLALYSLRLSPPAPKTFPEARQTLSMVAHSHPSPENYGAVLNAYLENKGSDRRDEKLLRLCVDFKPTPNGPLHAAMAQVASERGLGANLRELIPRNAEEAHGMILLLGASATLDDVRGIARGLTQSVGGDALHQEVHKFASSFPPDSPARQAVLQGAREPAPSTARTSGSGAGSLETARALNGLLF